MSRAGRIVCLVTAQLALSVVLPLAAQSWRGTGRASGIIWNPAGEPIRGATVQLRWARDAEQGPRAVTTNKKGRWAVLGLSAGRWLLTVEADGYRQSQGSLEVRSGATPPVAAR